MEVQIQAQSSPYHITQTIDGHAISIGEPLGNSCTVPALARAIYGKRRGGKKVSGGGH